jgi:hypothetical protein
MARNAKKDQKRCRRGRLDRKERVRGREREPHIKRLTEGDAVAAALDAR